MNTPKKTITQHDIKWALLPTDQLLHCLDYRLLFRLDLRGLIKVFFGFNLASLCVLFRSGVPEFLRACLRSLFASFHTDSYDLARIPLVTLHTALAGRNPEIKLPIVKHEDGMLPIDEALAFVALTVAENPSQILEIGTFMGHTTKLLAMNLPQATIHTLDLPQEFDPSVDSNQEIPKDDFHLIKKRSVGCQFTNTPYAARIHQHFADSAKWDYASIGKTQFFYIDGSHTYEYCKSDSEKCLATCEGGEMFVWHDCDNSHPGVVRFILEWRQLGRNIYRIYGTPLAYWKYEKDI